MDQYPALKLRKINFTKYFQTLEKYFYQKFQHEFCDVRHGFFKLICYLKDNDSHVAIPIRIFSRYSICEEVKKDVCVT